MFFFSILKIRWETHALARACFLRLKGPVGTSPGQLFSSVAC